MQNYEYIIASLPILSHDWKANAHLDPEEVIAGIREDLSASDQKLVDLLLSGFQADNLTQEFYDAALKSRDSFIRQYFDFDLHVRNAKVRYLNKALGRLPEQDTLAASEEWEEEAAAEEVLSRQDLLEREYGLDTLMWDKVDSITLFDYFDIDAILGFIARLQIVARWLRLDEKTGREMFRRLVEQVRGTFTGVKYNDK